jgi:hypothetical protein
MQKTFYSFGQGVILGQAEEFKAFVEKSVSSCMDYFRSFQHYQQSIL